ncbi:hypothetical protein BD770DRAFT_165552 [Pilaira anomala]|nr:hypothetical protein BD770DRAFT_165552 [Pilaira anomala]
MSTVSIQNESLPSFEPIEHKSASQKRKRAVPTVKEDTDLPAIKKTRAKKSTRIPNQPLTITKSFVWIGATLSQDDSASGAFSVYYGKDDSRNYTEKLTLGENQGLDYVYIMGVLRALDICKNETSALFIYTGSKILQQNIDQESEMYSELRQKIEKREGSTFIEYKANSSDVQDEYKTAHDLSNEKLLEDKMIIDEEDTLVESLQLTETSTEVSVLTTTVETTIIKTKDVQVEKVVTTVEEELTNTSSTAVAEPTPSWASTLRLTNLLEILKAPFSRKNMQ